MDNKAAIEQVVQNYRDASFYGDAELFNKVFREDAIVSGFIPGDQEICIPAPAFIDLICNPEDGKTLADKGCDFRCEVTDVTIDEPIAQARFLEFDDDGTDYVTYFQLMKSNGEWKVISKLFIIV